MLESSHMHLFNKYVLALGLFRVEESHHGRRGGLSSNGRENRQLHNFDKD